jgi:hypothetical protein
MLLPWEPPVPHISENAALQFRYSRAMGGRDNNGNLLIIHCASGSLNHVVITGSGNFASVARPWCYVENN